MYLFFQKRRYSKILTSLALLFLITPKILSNEISDSSYVRESTYNIPKRIYNAEKLINTKPVIDGELDDNCWENLGEWQSDFTQREPRSGNSPTEKTAVKILYDEENLYVAIRAYDKEPGKIDRRSSRRDEMGGDEVGIALDSYFDHRTAYEFDISAAGIQLDAIPLNDGTSWDMNWNAVWYAKVALEDSAWTAEMCIPFSQLRFAEKKEQIWGLHVWRWINRKQEEDDWQYIPKDSPGMVHLYGELHGIKGIGDPVKFEVLPYLVSKVNTFKKEEGNPFATGKRNSFSAGLDGKLGVSSNLTMDFTINPDFGQVEADPSSINLTSFETFYSEKRPFFLEGKDILDFGISDGDQMFYSRRIGHKPAYTPEVNSGEFVRIPESTSILSALKLTGKTSNGISLGFISSLTAKENAEISSGNSQLKKTAEPLTHYFVGRFQKEYNEGNTIWGGMLTAVNRFFSEEYLKFINNAAYSAGVDLRHQWDNKTYYFNLKATLSNIKGDQQSIRNLQISPVHNFQRPDAEHLKYDSLRTSISGYGGMFSFGKEGNGRLRFSGSITFRSPGLELNDIGYLRQADLIIQRFAIGYVVNTPTDLFLNYSLYFNQHSDWDFGGNYIQTGYSLETSSQFHNFWGAQLNLSQEFPFLDTRVLRGGPAVKYTGDWKLYSGIWTDRTKKLSMELYYTDIIYEDQISRYTSLAPGITIRTSDRFNMSASINYSSTINDLQYIQTISWSSANSYLMGKMTQKTLGLTFRMEYYLTPELSVQYYGSPFVSAGKYSNFKKISNQPRAEKYSDRFHRFSDKEICFQEKSNSYFIDENSDGIFDYDISKPDFNFKEFRSNLVIRYEYKAGSTIYFIWSQGRTGFENNGEFSWGKDMRKLYDVYPDNIFLIKLNHWFSI
ncbi:MAG: DUF5916 domain-containing protein [Bacteroidota bacterium]|nr:DUF5916 domain-containing protein [Bacteroidota bacterium]